MSLPNYHPRPAVLHPEPHLRARPMTVVKLHRDCSMSFFTAIGSAKVHEALAERTGHVLCQSRSISINLGGGFTISQDPNEMEPLFHKKHQLWFKDGLDDPQLCLLTFHPHEAEVWDMSGTRGVRLIANLARHAFDDVDVKGGVHQRLIL